MELWIRNQDKTILKKCSRVSLSVNEDVVFIDGEYFGSYETKTRAMQVIDEIQKLLTPQVCELAQKLVNNEYSDYNKLTNVYAIMDSCGVVNVSELSTVIYEMPEE